MISALVSPSKFVNARFPTMTSAKTTPGPEILTLAQFRTRLLSTLVSYQTGYSISSNLSHKYMYTRHTKEKDNRKCK